MLTSGPHQRGTGIRAVSPSLPTSGDVSWGWAAPWLRERSCASGPPTGVLLTCGSEHHHHFLVRHESGSGKRGPEKRGERGRRGVGDGAGGPPARKDSAPTPHRPKGAASPETFGLRDPSPTLGPDTPSPARFWDPCPHPTSQRGPRPTLPPHRGPDGNAPGN